MTEDWRAEAFRAALKMVEDKPPKDIVARAQVEAADRGTTLTAADLTELLVTASGSDPFLAALGLQIHKWDATPATEDWTSETKQSTPERRMLVCQRIGLDEDGARVLLEKRPIFRDETVVISAPWERWYTPAVADARAFYWPRYRDYLLQVKEWPDDSVTSLDIATTDVVERLANPTRMEPQQAKGLVVGYVQSGKTANFTGVAAKAIDAGYRLIIVMTGTIEMLRSQTQRRIDMEMVGRQNILGDFTPDQAIEAKVDYQDDEAWLGGKFLDLGTGDLATEVLRLTSHRKDYQKQFRTLRIERVEMGRPLYDPDNLFRTGARLAIVKKNALVLGKLVNDIKANRTAFAEIPVLIIDDESDQASVNTVDPEKVRAAKAEGREIQARRAINRQIAAMLTLMPRAQYVGYTATPFANVFVDPADEQGIFPSDFVIGLQRPPDYMGVDDFHDLEERSDEEPTRQTSNRLAFVRALQAKDDEPDKQGAELAQAIDAFVLAGAVKLYRSSVDPNLSYRHHTMLAHGSVRTDAHRELAEQVKDKWLQADFASPSGKARLRKMYDEDTLPTSRARLEHGVPPAPSFDELTPFIGKAIGRITEHGHNPVIVVNSDTDVQRQQQALDFDRYSTWRILVGGAKLSRGFTVEGLTVTYFRRATNMTDSLTQMGRWFGFRRGYRDLVRLYIAEFAKFGNTTVDLYKAFESIALDEAAFREQIKRYAQWDGDKPRLRPSEIPPLVSQHLPWLKPTAKNKMFNAVLEEQSEQPFTPSGYPDSLGSMKHNLDLWRPLLIEAQDLVTLPEGPGAGTFKGYVGVVDAQTAVDVMKTSEYIDLYGDRSIRPKVAFYQRLIDAGVLSDFLLVLPQPNTAKLRVDGVGARAVVARDRRGGRGGKFGEVTDKKHRPVAVDFVDGRPADALRALHRPERGVILFYLARETKGDFVPAPDDPESGLVSTFSAYVPEAALAADPLVLTFRVTDANRRHEPTIDVPPHIASST